MTPHTHPLHTPRFLKHLAATGTLLLLMACSGGGDSPAPAPSAPPSTSSGDPVLHFTDLVSGPATGLGDPHGSGVIVTVWGQNLGNTQGSNSIEFCDAANTCRTGHVYYWKDADGALPGGPANLSESHGMQEIAFSIPAGSAMGAGSIRVTAGGDTSSLPFTVRAGRILHVKTDGRDDTGDGSFNRPFATVARADDGRYAQLGDTVYIHDVITGTATTDRAIYNNSGLQGTFANQFAYVSYPGKRAPVYGADGVHIYVTTGIVTSKLSVFSSNCDALSDNCFTDASGGIQSSDFGRVIGNKITDQPNGCADSMSGALGSSIHRGSGAKLYGNYIHDYSCVEATKFHHTTYFTIRDTVYDEPRDESMNAFELGWNYLKDNKAKNGLHFYDEDNHNLSRDRCGDFIGTLRVHDNVVANQAGAGIEYVINCGWSNDVHFYNNVLINVGLRHDINCTSNCGGVGAAMHLGGSNLLGDIHVYNNTVHTWDSTNWPGVSPNCVMLNGNDPVPLVGVSKLPDISFNDNVCYSAVSKPMYALGYNSPAIASHISGTRNVFHSPGQVAPSWATASQTTDPLLTVSSSRISVGAGSPLINQSTTTLPRDIYGRRRGATSNVGAVQ